MMRHFVCSHASFPTGQLPLFRSNDKHLSISLHTISRRWTVIITTNVSKIVYCTCLIKKSHLFSNLFQKQMIKQFYLFKSICKKNLALPFLKIRFNEKNPLFFSLLIFQLIMTACFILSFRLLK